MQRHVAALVETANLFDRAGYPDLLTLLAAPDQDNILRSWDNRLVATHRLLQSGHAAQALVETDQLLQDMDQSGVSGPAVLDLRAKLYGLRGQVFVTLGRFADSKAAFVLALEDCERNGDAEGIRIYRENLEYVKSAADERTPETEAELQVLQTFERAQQLAEQGRFKASNALFAGLLQLNAGPGPVMQNMKPHVMGRMGYNEYKLGNPVAARGLIDSARQLCVQHGDAASAEIYAENLSVLGEGTPSGASAVKQGVATLRAWLSRRSVSRH